MSDLNLRSFGFDGSTYDEAFRLFLAHTDQKTKANEWLGRFVEKLRSRRVFVDMGAGEGSITALLKDRFDLTIAIEPNIQLCTSLKTMSGIEVMQAKVEDTVKIPPSDLVLCSHVFYLISPSEWVKTIYRMAYWLSESGALVIINQNRDTDCRQMFEKFFGKRDDLASYLPNLETLEQSGFCLEVETIPSYVTAPDIGTACGIAEFLLGGKHDRPAPNGRAVKKYIQERFESAGSTYRLSCHQDILVIRRTAKTPRGQY